MPKLKLNVEALQVDSFEPGEAGAPRAGTVRAHVITDPGTTCAQSCGCPVTDLAHTCGCPDTSMANPCFCTEYQTCWNCDDA
jgi:hypothetical protein